MKTKIKQTKRKNKIILYKHSLLFGSKFFKVFFWFFFGFFCLVFFFLVTKWKQHEIRENTLERGKKRKKGRGERQQAREKNQKEGLDGGFGRKK